MDHQAAQRIRAEADRRDAAGGRRTALLEGQNAVLRLIATGQPLPQILDRIARLCEAFMPGAACSILLVDPDMTLRHGAAPSLPPAYTAAIDGVRAAAGIGSCGTAIAERRRVVVADIATHPYWAAYKDVALRFGLRACWSVCIATAGSQPLGSFGVYYRESRAPQDWELEIVDGLNDLTAIAIERHEAAQQQARLIADLERQRQDAEDARARLQQSEQSFRRFTEASSDWYWAQDANLRFTFMSSSNEPISGLRGEEHLGRTRHETMPLGVSAQQWAEHEADLAARRPFRDFRFQRIDPNGRLRHLSINGVPVFDPVDGSFKGYCGTGRDITAEVEAAATLRAVIDAIPAMINAKDTQSRYVLMNSYQAALYGTTPEEAVGRTAAELLGGAYGAYTNALDRRVIETGRSSGLFEETYPTADGVERHWLTAKLPLTDARGAVQHVISVAMDITALKTTERQLRASQQALSEAIVHAEKASQAKSDFLTNMSHELRTPLNAIIGFAEVMSSELLGPLGTPRYREYAADICRSGRFLHDLLSDLLDMAKIESGRRDLRLEPVDIVEETTESVRMLQPRAQAGRVALASELGAGPVFVTADRRAYCQIVLNLVSNAVKFTRPGGRVWIGLRRGADGLQLEVGDTGIGIADDQIDRLGVPFFRVGNPEQATTEGTGLGLALTKSLVELHGWRLRIASSLGRGTVVTIALGPQLEAAAAVSAAGSPPR